MVDISRFDLNLLFLSESESMLIVNRMDKNALLSQYDNSDKLHIA